MIFDFLAALPHFKHRGEDYFRHAFLREAFSDLTPADDFVNNVNKDNEKHLSEVAGAAVDVNQHVQEDTAQPGWVLEMVRRGR